MPGVLEMTTGASGYPRVLDHVLRHGRPREVRGLATREAGFLTVRIHDVTESLPLGIGRGVSRAVAAAEALQLIGAFSGPELLPPAFDRFKEDDGRFWGAYGERVGDQVTAALGKLRDDPGTRQAVITLWNPGLDNQPGRRDYPCTVMLTFEAEDDALHLTTVMRSQDVWLGTPYDWFQFTQLQQTAANALGLRPGHYTHVTLSSHLYEENVQSAQEIVDSWDHGELAGREREWQPRGLGVPGEDFIMVPQRAAVLRAHVASNRVFPLPADATPSEKWYAEHLRRYEH